MIRKNIFEPLLLSLPDSRDKNLLEYIRRIKKFAAGAKEKYEERFYAWNEIFSKKVRENILKKNNQELESMNFDFGKEMVCEIINSYASDRINRMLYVDLKNSLPNDMLTKVDLMSMKNALEVRVPFLDHRLVEFVFQLPGNLKLKGRTGKYILREAFKDILPPILLKRAKQGFEMPISQWLKSDLKFLIHEYLAREKIERQGIFHYHPIEKLIRDLFSNRSDTSWHIWNLIVFQAWYSRYFGL
jgi:asparagine synthase (glutamine-hydrolysing)